MTPPFFFVSLLSILMIWTITTVGLPSYCWTYFVVPCVSVYCLCDNQKLWEEVVREFTKSLRGASISVAIVAFLYVGYLPWKMIILLCCMFSLIKAFSSEKMMFSGDYCGQLVKFAWWIVAQRLFPNQVDRMGWNGDWSYCSPYSRAPRHRVIDFYYVLSEPVSREERIREPFDLEFLIEDCEVKCKYFAAGGYMRSSENVIGSRTPVPEVRQEPLPATVCKDEAGTSSSQRADGAGTSSSQRPDAAGTSSQRPDGAGTPSSQRPAGAGTSFSQRPDGAGTSSSQRPAGAVEGPIQSQTQVNKLEVTLSLFPGGEEIESFTFFQIAGNRVVEIKRAMEVLKNHGNLIFSSFHREMGSRTPRAHAGCYEFEEIFEMILNKGYTVRKVNLSSQHACSISGKAVMCVLYTAVLAWMQYYQLPSASQPSLIIMLFLFVFFQVFFIFLNTIQSEKEAAKKWLHSLIKCTMPNQVDCWYEYFQVKCPHLTFCNESYGQPYTFKDCRVICCFVGTTVQAVSTRTEYFTLDNIFDVGVKDYHLRNVNLNLDIRRDEEDDEGEALVVSVTCTWARNGEVFYHSPFRVIDRRRISNLIAVLKWLSENDCQGVCKKWKKSKMMVFTYEELVAKILDDTHYHCPWLIHLNGGMNIYVE